MLNNAKRLLVFLFGMALLWDCCGAANAATPMVAAASDYSLGLSADGKVFGWGNDGNGQLGLGRSVFATAPQVVPGLNLGQGSGKSRVAAGLNHIVALKSDGTVWAWGSNSIGQLGDGTTTNRSSPVQVPGLTGVVAVAAGFAHTLALKSDGSLWVWGSNSSGQLGDGTTTYYRTSPVQVPGLTGVVAVAGGGYYSLALKSDGSVWAWGMNDYGQLGDGTKTNRSLPVQVPGLTGVLAVLAGYSHSVAVKADGTLWAWGSNSSGQLGDGTTMIRSSPVQSPGITGVVAVAAGNGSTAALKADGTVWETILISTNGVYSSQWRQVAGITGAAAVTAGLVHKLAFKSDGSVWAWGSNDYGQLGDGTTTYRSSPLPVLNGITASAAGGYNSVAVKSDGSVWTWGRNDSGQLGDGSNAAISAPMQASGLSGVLAVAAGDQHTLALKSDGSVWAAGNNNAGRLGDGTGTSSSKYVQALGLSSIVALAAGSDFSLALKSDGTVWAWGTNFYGQLGNGTNVTPPPSSTPKQINELGNVVAIAAANQGQSFALKADGTLWAWGRNDYGQLGVASTVACIVAFTNLPCSTCPRQVGTGYKAIAAEHYHTLAIKYDGTLWAWGNNKYGQLGDGTTTDRSSPVQVTGITGVLAVAAGYSSNVALKADGTVWETTITLTNGVYGSQWRQVAGITGATAVAVGNSHKLAVKSDGSVWAWGYNSFGQLGDGTLAAHYSPVLVVNSSLDGFLNLKSGIPVNVPPGLQVPFFVSSTGGITNTSATVSTTTKFNAADVGKSGAVFVTARVPSGSLGGVQQAMTGNKVPRAKAFAASDASSFVLMQLTPSGWQPVVNGQLIPYASGVLGDQLAAQTILNGTDTTNLKGAQFCLGYGTSADQMIATGTIRAVATIIDPNNPTDAAGPNCLPNYSDSWWNASESGWGITITDHDTNAFVQWYTYDQTGHNQKYVISGGTFSNGKCLFSGTIYHVTGPGWALPAFDPAQVTRATAGSGSIDFCPSGLAAGTIVFNYSNVDGVTGSKQLTRLPFGDDVPHLGGTANTGAADFTDLWWNSSEPGWGVSVTQHGNNLVFRIFVYDDSSRPLLFVVPSVTFNSASSFTGNVALTTGPWFGSNPFDPNQVVRTATPGNTATLTFSDANNGVLSYTVNGITKTKAITRLAF